MVDPPPRGTTPGIERPELLAVLESAARLQEIVPDAVLVGGAAAALWANHRASFDHDHVLEDLTGRFDMVLDAIEETDGWVTNRATPGKIILGALGGIDRYYADQRGPGAAGVATQLAQQLADPRPRDRRTIAELDHYKDLDPRWADWQHVTGACRSLAVEMAR